VPARKLLLNLQRLLLIGLVVGGLLGATGCRSTGYVAATSQAEASADPHTCALMSGTSAAIASPPPEWPVGGSPGETAQRFYWLANDAQQDGEAYAPEYYYQAAMSSWPCLSGGDGSLSSADAWQIYHTSVAGLVAEGQRLGRFNQRGQMALYLPGATVSVPFVCMGLPWEPRDIGKLFLTEPSHNGKITNYHASQGFGVPIVAIRQASGCPTAAERFFVKQLPFAATIVLRPASGTNNVGASQVGVLEFYGPLQVRAVTVQGQAVPLARDLSAPFEYQLQTTANTGMLGFLDPDVGEGGEGLRFIEPYQPGKIPVVFVHGLLSDPSTWFDMANDLQNQPWFKQHYQIWAFRYPTGKPFVKSAMDLRNQLQQAVTILDPQASDPALRQMVLIGHSMGGLVAKLQVAHSEDRIWNSFAFVPVESLKTSEKTKGMLSERCFFDPQPFVQRVVFVATPHGGSTMAARTVGRIGAALVRPGAETEEIHDQLIEDNPDAFLPQLSRRAPTSMDMLEPENPALQAIRTLRLAPCVKLHSIIGTGGTMIGDGPGDGVVAVSSALHPGVVSQRFVDATHTSIQRHPDTQIEIQNILQMHLAENRRNVAQ
jgi:pimeloyl-ACP methyl ester carboxylesterase